MALSWGYLWESFVIFHLVNSLESNEDFTYDKVIIRKPRTERVAVLLLPVGLWPGLDRMQSSSWLVDHDPADHPSITVLLMPGGPWPGWPSQPHSPPHGWWTMTRLTIPASQSSSWLVVHGPADHPSITVLLMAGGPWPGWPSQPHSPPHGWWTMARLTTPASQSSSCPVGHGPADHPSLTVLLMAGRPWPGWPSQPYSPPHARWAMTRLTIPAVQSSSCPVDHDPADHPSITVLLMAGGPWPGWPSQPHSPPHGWWAMARLTIPASQSSSCPVGHGPADRHSLTVLLMAGGPWPGWPSQPHSPPHGRWTMTRLTVTASQSSSWPVDHGPADHPSITVLLMPGGPWPGWPSQPHSPPHARWTMTRLTIPAVQSSSCPVDHDPADHPSRTVLLMPGGPWPGWPSQPYSPPHARWAMTRLTIPVVQSSSWPVDHDPADHPSRTVLLMPGGTWPGWPSQPYSPPHGRWAMTRLTTPAVQSSSWPVGHDPADHPSRTVLLMAGGPWPGCPPQPHSPDGQWTMARLTTPASQSWWPVDHDPADHPSLSWWPVDHGRLTTPASQSWWPVDHGRLTTPASQSWWPVDHDRLTTPASQSWWPVDHDPADHPSLTVLMASGPWPGWPPQPHSPDGQWTMTRLTTPASQSWWPVDHEDPWPIRSLLNIPLNERLWVCVNYRGRHEGILFLYNIIPCWHHVSRDSMNRGCPILTSLPAPARTRPVIYTLARTNRAELLMSPTNWHGIPAVRHPSLRRVSCNRFGIRHTYILDWLRIKLYSE